VPQVRHAVPVPITQFTKQVPEDNVYPVLQVPHSPIRAPLPQVRQADSDPVVHGGIATQAVITPEVGN